ncbi:MAG TPA: methylmalonyl Co-A mutase-associated GTPase MeaB [Chitinophagaceae bacterium]|nr:methylmalonyl Co-A mutase-associated GTPase MeaB [Chitinophagaceae bacterium]
MPEENKYLAPLKAGNSRLLSRCISAVENEWPGYEELLLTSGGGQPIPVIGITGAPGAGKSTLIHALVQYWLNENKKIAVLSVDPSSPFHHGALLGDRIRMQDVFLHPDVFIRSLASRGALGGLNYKMLEILQVLQLTSFNYILIETVGVGQSEVEIAGIADTTLVLTVPEGGDEVQTMKSGLMEIADIFIVNKCDRDQADLFVKNLQLLVHERTQSWETPVIRCIATKGSGIQELNEAIQKHQRYREQHPEHRLNQLYEKAYQLIREIRMKDIRKEVLLSMLQEAQQDEHFNLFRWVRTFYPNT